MSIPARLVLATGNAGKLREMREILAPWQAEVRSLAEFTPESAAETGLTFVENALLKARFAARASGLPAIADDSGLEVDALHGAPGIYSARYAGPACDDAANNAKLLLELEPIADAARTARYRCAMVYLRWPEDPSPVIVQAAWEGRIGRVARGAGGFGYDPLFLVGDGARTAAEFAPADKNLAQSSRPGAARPGRRTRVRRDMIDARQIPLALYVHLPWCVRKCPYCDFNSHAVPAGGIAEQAYVTALQRDLEHAATGAAGREIVAVFFGGGTPSLFSPAAIGRVLEHARGLLPFAADVEITLEANPGTIEHGRFSEYAAAGVNRVSVGAQSFDDERLAVLGRIHGANDTARAVDELRAAGIDNFNLDLMYALPGQDLRGALADLERAIELGPTHLSHYQLTLEPDTPFARRPPPLLPDDEVAWTMQVECQARLADAGFEQYEVSGYAQRGRRCRHNLVYWEYGDYLGVGAGAHGKLTRVHHGRDRTHRSRSTSRGLSRGRLVPRSAWPRCARCRGRTCRSNSCSTRCDWSRDSPKASSNSGPGCPAPRCRARSNGPRAADCSNGGTTAGYPRRGAASF